MANLATLDVAIGRSTVGLAERARGISVLWAVAAVIAVLYGSLLPFSFDPARLTPGTGFGLLRIGLHRVSLEDLLTNIFVYLPVGLTVALAARARRSVWGQVAIATAVGGAVSVLAESLQSSMPIRVACWSDVALNTSGALLGAALARSSASLVREVLRRCVPGEGVERPMKSIAGFFAIGLFLYQLAPFDFITTTSELHASFRMAEWSLLSPRAADPMTPSSLFYGKAVATAWFIALGYLIARSRREAGVPPVGCAMTAVLEGGALIVVLEVLQLFIRSHVFDAADIPLRIAAVVMGAWVAVFLLDQAAPQDRAMRQRRAVPSPVDRAVETAVMVVWAVGHVIAILAQPLARRGAAAISSSRITWPFERLWRAPMLDAGWHIGSTLVVYAILAALILMILRRGRVTFAEPLTAAMIALIGLDAALLASPSGVQGVDPTSAILATVAGILVVSLATRNRSAPHPGEPANPTPRSSLAE